jgi:hypothetical protein
MLSAMSDTTILLGPSEVDSIVLGAAENEARRLGFTISPPAKDLLLQRSLSALNRENQEGRLESRRTEVEGNTAALIEHIVTEQVSSGESRQITYQHMFQGLSAFCRKFRELYPFCT